MVSQLALDFLDRDIGKSGVIENSPRRLRACHT